MKPIVALVMLSLVGCGHATSGVVSGAAPSTSVPAGDWPTFNRTLAGDRYSPLAEIDRSNVGRLGVVCRYALPEVTALQTGPIVVGGVMYFTTDTISYAIDAGTCAERWKVVRHSPTPNRLAVNRGAAYMNGRLFRGTSDAHVIAMDAADGRTLWDITLDVAGRGVTVPMAPTAWNGLVFVGNAGGDLSGIIGHVYALDAGDGHVVWRFDVVPSTGPARATWPTADRYPISGGAFWTAFTLDERTGVLYVAAEIQRLTMTLQCATERISIRILSLRSMPKTASSSHTTSSSSMTSTIGMSTVPRLSSRHAPAGKSPRRRTRMVSSRLSIAES